MFGIKLNTSKGKRKLSRKSFEDMACSAILLTQIMQENDELYSRNLIKSKKAFFELYDDCTESQWVTIRRIAKVLLKWLPLNRMRIDKF